MKKLSKTFAAISALALILSAGMFVSCSDSDDSDNGGNTTNTVVDDSQNQPEGTTGNNGGSVEQTVTVNASWDFTSNARDGTAVDGVSATKGGSQPTSEIELTTNKTGSGATMKVLTATICEWNGKMQFSTGSKDVDLFTITTDADCTAVIKVGSASSSKTSGKVNALKLGDTTIYDFDSIDTKDAVEKTVSLTKGANKFTGSGITIATVKLSN